MEPWDKPQLSPAEKIPHEEQRRLLREALSQVHGPGVAVGASPGISTPQEIQDRILRDVLTRARPPRPPLVTRVRRVLTRKVW
jgi:hypothetical protein